jgi:hypothetical protein
VQQSIRLVPLVWALPERRSSPDYHPHVMPAPRGLHPRSVSWGPGSEGKGGGDGMVMIYQADSLQRRRAHEVGLLLRLESVAVSA